MTNDNVIEIRPLTSKAKAKLRLGVLMRKVITYVGAFGGWYLTDEMLDFFAAARKNDPNVFALVLTQTDLPIKDELAKRGYSDADMFVAKVPAADVPQYVEAADVAISFIMPSYSKQASSPTKIAEYLACGVPVISNKGVGDVDLFLVEDRVGVLLDDFSEQSYIKALREIEQL